MAETLDQFARRLDGVDLHRQFVRVAKLWALEGEAYAAREAFTAAGLHRRTGRLANSVSASTRELGATGIEYELRAGGDRGGVDVRYAQLQEKGGTVRPLTGKWLAIPVGPARTAAGVPRYRSARDVPDLHSIELYAGRKAMLAKRLGRGKSARLEPWFILVRSVTVPARPFIGPAMRHIQVGLAADIRAEFDKVVAGGRS